jgi:hypothetical protein
MVSPAGLWEALRLVGALLGTGECHAYRRAFHFPLSGAGYTLAISPDSAHRIRVDCCLYAVPVASLWTPCDDNVRLARIVAEFERMGATVGA